MSAVISCEYQGPYELTISQNCRLTKVDFINLCSLSKQRHDSNSKIWMPSLLNDISKYGLYTIPDNVTNVIKEQPMNQTVVWEPYNLLEWG